MKWAGMRKTSRYITITALGSLLFLSCVYFNTFYNAKTAFRKARELQTKRIESTSVEDSVIVVSEAEKKQYERAIEKSSKVLEVYPQKKKWADDAIFLIGKSYFFMAEYLKAIRKFQELLSYYPQSPHAPLGQLFLGKSLMKNGDYEEAIVEFEKFRETYPEHEQAEMIPVLIAEASIGLGTKSGAIEALNSALKNVSPQQANLIKLKIARLYFELEQYDASFKTYQSIKRSDLSYKDRYEVRFRSAQCLLKSEKPKDALQMLEALSTDNRYYDHIAEILIEQGACYEKMENFEKAITVYLEAADSNNQAVYVAIANFKIAEIYQYQYGDLAKAKEFYDKASKSPKKSMEMEALRRSANITSLESFKSLMRGDSVQSDTGDVKPDHPAGHTRFRLAELYWFQLDRQDSAYRWLSQIVADSACDSLYGKRAAYALSVMYRENKKDTARSDSMLKLILDRYPDSEYAKAAQKELGVPVTVRTPEDSAREAFIEAETVLWENRTYREAAALYDSLSIRYAHTRFGAKAAFTSAWIYDEMLHDSAAAAERYMRVKKDFKETKYAGEAEKKLKAAIFGVKAVETKEERKKRTIAERDSARAAARTKRRERERENRKRMEKQE